MIHRASKVVLGDTPNNRIEEGALVEFARSPLPWAKGDMAEIKDASGGKARLIVIEKQGLHFSWQYNEHSTFHIDLEHLNANTFTIRLQPQHIEIQRVDDARLARV
jgi:hypothetical protein